MAKKEMKEVRLDLFKLYNKDEKIKGSIKIILTNKLKKLIKNIIEEIKTKEKLKTSELSEKLGVRYSTLRMSFKRNRLSLNFIKRLLDSYSHDKKIEIIDEIKKRTARSLLNSLEKMKVLKSRNNGFYKVWSINSNLKNERR